MVQASLSLILGTVALITTSTFAIPIRNIEARDVDVVSSLAVRAARPRPPASRPAAKARAPVKQVKPQMRPAKSHAAVKHKPQVKPTKPHALVKPKPGRPKAPGQNGNWFQGLVGGVGKAAKDVKNVADKALPVAKEVVNVAGKAAPYVNKVAPVAGKVLPVVQKALPFAEKLASFLRREFEERDSFDEDWLLSREIDVDELD
jgi:hypothetical protein